VDLKKKGDVNVSWKLTNIASSQPMKQNAATTSWKLCPQNEPEDMLRYGDSYVQLAAVKSNASSQAFGAFKNKSHFQTPTSGDRWERHFLLWNLHMQTYAYVPDDF